jgi:hypothetical protein
MRAAVVMFGSGGCRSAWLPCVTPFTMTGTTVGSFFFRIFSLVLSHDPAMCADQTSFFFSSMTKPRERAGEHRENPRRVLAGVSLSLSAP